MSRRYIEHQRRNVISLDGYWEFTYLGSQHPDMLDVSTITFDDLLPVPGCFDAMPQYAGKRGLAAYRTRLAIKADTSNLLVFKGVNNWCRIYANGHLLTEHRWGFTRFTVMLPKYQEDTSVEVLVIVSNAFDADRSPLHYDYFDWYQYGGIIRSVEWHQVSDVWIEGCRVITEDYEARRIALSLTYHATEAGAIPLRVSCDAYRVLDSVQEVQAGTGDITYTLELPDASLWSPQTPNLHMLDVRLGDDDLRVRFGIRQVAAVGQQIHINGAPIRLLGCNRHEFHPDYGHTLPDATLINDVQRLKDMGCNFVRGSHYPQDERFLDLCDEFGICVWSESIGWQHDEAHLTNERFVEAQLTHTEEMIAATVNHASVILWGILNESASHKESCQPAYTRLLAQLKALDASRPVTYASNHPFDDVCLLLADVVSINTYPGWYIGSIEGIPAHLDEIVAHLDRAGCENKPLIISEIGAGAIPGWRDAHGQRWTEQYQAALLDVVIKHLFVYSERFAGLAFWLFSDFRTPSQIPNILMRPRGFNNKGVLDEYRRPKQAYKTVKAAFNQLNTTT